MAQVSGSIALDLSKVERGIVAQVMAELTRTTPTAQEAEHGISVPLDTIAEVVAARVVTEQAVALMEIHVKLGKLTELMQAEAQRRERLTGTGEHPLVVNGPDGRPLYELDPAALAALAARGHGPAWDLDPTPPRTEDPADWMKPEGEGR